MNSRSSCCYFMLPYSSAGRGVVRLIRRLARSFDHGIWGGWFSWMALSELLTIGLTRHDASRFQLIAEVRNVMLCRRERRFGGHRSTAPWVDWTRRAAVLVHSANWAECSKRWTHIHKSFPLR